MWRHFTLSITSRRRVVVGRTWRRGVVVAALGVPTMNEVTLRRTRLVPGWVTVFGGPTTSVCSQSPRPTISLLPYARRKWIPAKVRWCSAAGSTGRMPHSICEYSRGCQVKLCDPSLTRVIPEHLRDEYRTHYQPLYNKLLSCLLHSKLLFHAKIKSF